MSLILRHQPEVIQMSLSHDGWADMGELIEKANHHGFNFSRESIAEIVATSDKQRFKISDDGQRIRANQGHSVPVDVGLERKIPPETLFHGTATRFIESIQAQGLIPGSRQYVHLSADEATATQVGKRHGEPVVLSIESAKMHADGFEFFLSENQVWLTKQVPAECIKF
ncbi:MAG: RNA 2'-phosphotransferase [Oculatellaceae cyanobacterium Prado106]|nr:RNA 2'-phosphotransferase [Oculatellaceae cyanobacterium Prado106]